MSWRLRRRWARPRVRPGVASDEDMLCSRCKKTTHERGVSKRVRGRSGGGGEPETMKHTMFRQHMSRATLDHTQHIAIYTLRFRPTRYSPCKQCHICLFPFDQRCTHIALAAAETVGKAEGAPGSRNRRGSDLQPLLNNNPHTISCTGIAVWRGGWARK